MSEIYSLESVYKIHLELNDKAVNMDLLGHLSSPALFFKANCHKPIPEMSCTCTILVQKKILNVDTTWSSRFPRRLTGVLSYICVYLCFVCVSVLTIEAIMYEYNILLNILSFYYQLNSTMHHQGIQIYQEKVFVLFCCYFKSL